MEWRFRPMSEGEINVDPIEGEFFTTDALDSHAAGLVREAIQNSLDARIPGQKVRVRFRYSGPKLALGQEERKTFLEGLWPHPHRGRRDPRPSGGPGTGGGPRRSG